MRLDYNRQGEQSPGLSISRDVLKRPKLFIASLSYDGKFNYEFVSSLTKTLKLLWSKHIETDVYYCNNDPFIERARNTLIEKFHETDCSHFLTIDADQGWDENKVLEMLELNLPVISGAVPIKDPAGENYSLKIMTNWDMTPMVFEKGLLKAHLVGAAFLMIRRDTFKKLRDAHPGLECRSISPNYYAYFKTETIGQIFWGEDMTFCRRCNEAEIPIMIMPDINFKHVGSKVWTGNYHEYLMRQPQPDYQALGGFNIG